MYIYKSFYNGYIISKRAKILNKITTVQKTHKLWGRCPRSMDSPTSLSESEREAERTGEEIILITILTQDKIIVKMVITLETLLTN